ncbi:MAG: hypothetical protein GDA43_00810 [Hormoscilla sp. SP5CHS1]|nr:hypothetical protein [Hormoscilla sp. SP5CHS1]
MGTAHQQSVGRSHQSPKSLRAIAPYKGDSCTDEPIMRSHHPQIHQFQIVPIDFRDNLSLDNML